MIISFPSVEFEPAAGEDFCMFYDQDSSGNFLFFFRWQHIVIGTRTCISTRYQLQWWHLSVLRKKAQMLSFSDSIIPHLNFMGSFSLKYVCFASCPVLSPPLVRHSSQLMEAANVHNNNLLLSGCNDLKAAHPGANGLCGFRAWAIISPGGCHTCVKKTTAGHSSIDQANEDLVEHLCVKAKTDCRGIELPSRPILAEVWPFPKCCI